MNTASDHSVRTLLEPLGSNRKSSPLLEAQQRAAEAAERAGTMRSPAKTVRRQLKEAVRHSGMMLD